jgi:hypothetical protein
VTASPAQVVEDGRMTGCCPPAFMLRYSMDDRPRLTPTTVTRARRRRLAAMRLQEIEGNPLSADEVAMFEMFEREGRTDERRRAYVLSRVGTRATE